jgi:hypothetical protein
MRKKYCDGYSLEHQHTRDIITKTKTNTEHFKEL